jgi:DNA-binding FadR family transcriptional regulator
LRDLIERRQDSTLCDPQRQREMIVEHAAIIVVVAARDPDAARKAARVHVHRATTRRLINQRWPERRTKSR